MSNNKSCVGCKYLYGNGTGYSNYTWMDTFVECAKNKNPNLIDAELPSDWNKDSDNWSKTNSSRCELYSIGEFITLDPDRDFFIDCPNHRYDIDQILAIAYHDRPHKTIWRNMVKELIKDLDESEQAFLLLKYSY